MMVWATIDKILSRGAPCVLVSVLTHKGSVPRHEGAHMIVTDQGYHGTIGGGTLEWQAQAQAQKMLQGADTYKVLDFALGPDLGQCCGGRVQLYFERMLQREDVFINYAAQELETLIVSRNGYQLAFGEPRRQLLLFGAGHVGRAMMLTLASLPFDVLWIDGRENAFPNVTPRNISTRKELDWTQVSHNSIAFILTHSHALDLDLTAQALQDDRIARVGLIGSDTKRARFTKRLRELGVSDAQLSKLVCPIGIEGIASKLPQAIALSTAAQALQWHEALQDKITNIETVAQHG